MAKETINVPDLGGAEGVEVIEVLVAEGDSVAAEDSLLVLESDKASMEVPSPKSGKVSAIHVKVGDTVSEGDAIFEMEVEGSSQQQESPSAHDADDSEETSQPAQNAAADEAKEEPAEDNSADSPDEKPAASANNEGESGGAVKKIEIPDIGGDAEVIEVYVNQGDAVEEGDSLVVLESDKASMEVPSPYTGVIRSVTIKVGDAASTGTLLGEMEVQGETASTGSKEPTETVRDAEPEPETETETDRETATASASSEDKPFRSANPAMADPTPVTGPTVETHPGVYAGPAVRKMAREFGIPLEEVKGTGPRDRIVKEDLQDFVKNMAKGAGSASAALPVLPEVDFAEFGPVRTEARSKLAKLTAANMQRNWLNLPHVTQFDDADISELEAFRAELKREAEQRGVKLTPLPFLLKASAAALRAHPEVNASLAKGGDELVLKDYCHIGMAVDTPAGLVVPVIRDVDQKSLWQLAEESAELAQRARDRKLKPADMQGGCFTVSSLGGIGGNGFTPIINAPELAILGVSKLVVKPVWDGEQFQPRKMLPLSLSYDHRALNGATAGAFLTELVAMLGDIRRLLL